LMLSLRDARGLEAIAAARLICTLRA